MDTEFDKNVVHVCPDRGRRDPKVRGDFGVCHAAPDER
jgi:hypothetical protein